MKFLKFLSILAVSLFLFSFTVFDYSHSTNVEENTITWKGEKVAGAHDGTISLKSGDLQFNDQGILTGGSFVVDMNTISCSDLKGEWGDKLVGHLNSEDFFNVAKYPEAHFTIDQVNPKEGKNEYLVNGKLKIKNIEHELSFPATVTEIGGKRMAKADITVDRTLYDIKYGSGKFFQGLGDKMIKDNFELQVVLTSN